MEFDCVHQSAFGVGKCFVATSNTLQFVLILVALCHCDSGSMMHILTFGVCVCVVNSVSCSSEKKNKQRAYNDNIENGRQMPVCGIPLRENVGEMWSFSLLVLYLPRTHGKYLNVSRLGFIDNFDRRVGSDSMRYFDGKTRDVQTNTARLSGRLGQTSRIVAERSAFPVPTKSSSGLAFGIPIPGNSPWIFYLSKFPISLQIPNVLQALRGSFSAVSTPIFASQ